MYKTLTNTKVANGAAMGFANGPKLKAARGGGARRVLLALWSRGLHFDFGPLLYFRDIVNAQSLQETLHACNCPRPPSPSFNIACALSVRILPP